MSEIKVNDLVRVARGMTCCGKLLGSEGKIFTVTAIKPMAFPQACAACGSIDDVPGVLGLAGNAPIDLDRLEKIDPPASGELKGVPLRLKEPA